jgi:2-isopropylmalate synthase
MELAGGGEAAQRGERYGAGIDSNIVTASIKALLSGVNRLGDAGRNAGQAKAA